MPHIKPEQVGKITRNSGVLVVFICIYLIGIHNQKKPMLKFIKNNNSYEVQSYTAGHTLSDAILLDTHISLICVGGTIPPYHNDFFPLLEKHFKACATAVFTSCRLSAFLHEYTWLSQDYFPQWMVFSIYITALIIHRTYWEQTKKERFKFIMADFFEINNTIIFKFAGNLVLTIHLIYIILL